METQANLNVSCTFKGIINPYACLSKHVLFSMKKGNKEITSYFIK